MRSRSALRARLAGLVALVVISTPALARALSCADPDWVLSPLTQGGSFTVYRSVPADVQPWLFAPCSWSPSECTLVAADDVVAVSGEADACVSGRARFTLTPERPLLVGQVYGLACPDSPDLDFYDEPTPAPGRLAVVEGAAVPPISIAITDADITLSDDGCCSDGGPDELVLEVVLGDAAAAFFAEGGRIDLTSPGGDIGSISDVDAAWRLPPEDGAWTFVAVAADGTRGEPVTLGEDEIRREPVYIPCQIARRQGLPLPLIAPFLWLALGRRRRAHRSR